MSPQLLPHPSLSPLIHLLILTPAISCPMAPVLSSQQKKKEKREIEAEEEDEGVGSEVEEMSIYFPSLWPA